MPLTARSVGLDVEVDFRLSRTRACQASNVVAAMTVSVDSRARSSRYDEPDARFTTSTPVAQLATVSHDPVVLPLRTRTSMTADVPAGVLMLHDGTRLLAEKPVDFHGEVHVAEVFEVMVTLPRETLADETVPRASSAVEVQRVNSVALEAAWAGADNRAAVVAVARRAVPSRSRCME
jgi:hypothetical protein